MPKPHRCKECTLLRVEFEGFVCDECIANMLKAESDAFKSTAPPTGGWYNIWPTSFP